MLAPWRNLSGPARPLAVCATILLIASGLGVIEAGIMIILGPARDIVIRPFIILGYLEFCAMFFSLIGIVLSIVSLIFYWPYLWISDKLRRRRARRTGEAANQYTYQNLYRAPLHHREEDGTPD